MSHGRRSAPWAAGAPLAALPQWRQKRAPAGSGWRHAGQAIDAAAPPVRLDPQALQKRPEALAPQVGHTVEVVVTFVVGEGGPAAYPTEAFGDRLERKENSASTVLRKGDRGPNLQM